MYAACPRESFGSLLEEGNMRILEYLYRSPLGRVMSAAASVLASLQKPFMVYGFVDPATREFRKYTRMSSTTSIVSAEHLAVADHVWIWHHSILDATGGLSIGEGCQIGAWVGMFTHGSENAIRLLGRQFINIPNSQRLTYTRGKVSIGAYTFVGSGSLILPGATIGKGCLIAAGTVVNMKIPDYSIAAGNPAKLWGRTVDLDRRFFKKHDYSDTYYDVDALNEIRARTGGRANSE
jgi:acetyltransferase-like isoleucine patch superfamily enzyme